MTFDVIVVGAGHAGVEAAYAAARMGCHVGLCTLVRYRGAHAMQSGHRRHGEGASRSRDRCAWRPHGPSIDATGIQFKLLNRSRGPAVWSPRAQADKSATASGCAATLGKSPILTGSFGRAGRIIVDHGRVKGLRSRTAIFSCVQRWSSRPALFSMA